MDKLFYRHDCGFSFFTSGNSGQEKKEVQTVSTQAGPTVPGMGGLARVRYVRSCEGAGAKLDFLLPLSDVGVGWAGSKN